MCREDIIPRGILLCMNSVYIVRRPRATWVQSSAGSDRRRLARFLNGSKNKVVAVFHTYVVSINVVSVRSHST
jgi:hypothetical protein